MGTGVAMVTPFSEGKVDFKALEALTTFLITGGVEYLVVLGTTGESVTLSSSERKEVLKAVAQASGGKVMIVAGFGGNNTAEVVKAIEGQDFKGIDGVLSVSPYYNKPSQEGIISHYKAVGNASPVPVIAYNVPGRTGSNMTAATTLKIAAEAPNIVGIKEASGNLVQCMEIVKGKPEGFLVISGDDVLTLPMIALGMDGVISVIANVFPRQFSGMVREALAGDFESARKAHYDLLMLMDLLFREGSPPGIKASLFSLGMMRNEFRLPVVPVSDQLLGSIGAETRRIAGKK